MYTVEIKGQEPKTFMHMVKSAGTSVHAGIIDASVSYTNYKVHVNQRHAHIRNLPEKYRKYKKYVVLREPHKWYKSFYRFFIAVEGYLSWALNDPREDGYIYPIEPDEFVRRMLNMKDTFINFPNKAKVFRNLLRSQAHMHFVTGYFESDFHPKDPETLEQFDMSLYEWFLKPMGDNTIPVSMNRLDIIEDEFQIKIPHINATDPSKIDFNFSKDTVELIKETHKKYYEIIEKADKA